jgi:hypothetical protein
LATEIAQAGYRRAMTCYTNRALAKACLDFYRSIE